MNQIRFGIWYIKKESIFKYIKYSNLKLRLRRIEMTTIETSMCNNGGVTITPTPKIES